MGCRQGYAEYPNNNVDFSISFAVLIGVLG